MMQASHDVIVIGGGPGGAAAATLLAQRGRQVLLLERDTEPRFKLGESLMPQTYFTFERMGFLAKMKASHFVPKHSVQFFAQSGKASAPFYFADEVPDDSARTWQVLRAELDQMLLDHAAEAGVECRRGVAVRDLLLDGERVSGVRVTTAGGATREIAARVVVDASGQSSVIARKLGLERVDYGFNHASIYTHYRGAHRDPGIAEGATLVLNTETGASWFWYIPLADDIVSVGVVGSVDYLVKERATTPEETFAKEVDRCAPLKQRIAGAERCRPIAVIKDFSYRWRQMAGEGWVLVGDAYSFIDPVYSSGVFLALKSGELAAAAILDAFAQNDFSAARLGAFQPQLLHGIDAVRGLVAAFYDTDFSFGAFLKRYPEQQSAVTRILIGDVLERDFTGLFAAMAEMKAATATAVG